jgi:hypothetical protein
MTIAAAKETVVVTKAELEELAEWEKKYSDATKKQTAAEKELKFRRQQLAEKVLGVTSSDELKALSPEQIARRQAKRLEAGDWRPGANAPEFQFVKTSSGSYPAWKKFYIDELGETAASRIAADAPTVYSYRVEVSAQ